MGSRLELHEVLCEFLGSRNAYFDSPESVKMNYPAIRYSRKPIEKSYANNGAYRLMAAYELTLIDWDSESEMLNKILTLPMCRHDRHYVVDNLHHDTFTLYY